MNDQYNFVNTVISILQVKLLFDFDNRLVK